jgi:hypothetical protein
MVSNKQLKANQQNALLGGVKTPEGKAISKFNAFKHGILSQSVTEYEKGFYSNIIDDLEEQYQPIGIIERVLIERIAIYYLKLFRVQKAETEYMKSQLDPRITVTSGGINIDPEGLLGETVVINKGYKPTITDDDIQKLMEIYSRYETTIENRLFRAIHELERVQRLRKGERIPPPIMADINRLGSFGENNKNP